MKNIFLTSNMDKILNPYVLFFTNIAIIIATEMSGEFFFKEGIIHGIAILFIILTSTRIFAPRSIQDKTLKKFIGLALFALFIFAASHVIEFLSYYFIGEYTDAGFANVANFYIISLLVIIIGVEYILKSFYFARPKMIVTISYGSIGFFTALTALFFLQHNLISLEPDSLFPYLYVIGILGVSAFGCINVLEAKRLVPSLNAFLQYLTVALGFIAASAILNVIYEIVQDAVGLPDSQIVYIAHFAFYLSMSVMFLAFGRPLKQKDVVGDTAITQQ